MDKATRIANIEAFIEKGEQRVKRLRDTLDAWIAEVEGAKSILETLTARPEVPLSAGAPTAAKKS